MKVWRTVRHWLGKVLHDTTVQVGVTVLCVFLAAVYGAVTVDDHDHDDKPHLFTYATNQVLTHDPMVVESPLGPYYPWRVVVRATNVSRTSARPRPLVSLRAFDGAVFNAEPMTWPSVFPGRSAELEMPVNLPPKVVPVVVHVQGEDGRQFVTEVRSNLVTTVVPPRQRK